jgi:predicted DNA-binding protein
MTTTKHTAQDYPNSRAYPAELRKRLRERLDGLASATGKTNARSTARAK